MCSVQVCWSTVLQNTLNLAEYSAAIHLLFKFYSLTFFFVVYYILTSIFIDNDFNISLSSTLAQTALPQDRMEASHFVQILTATRFIIDWN